VRGQWAADVEFLGFVTTWGSIAESVEVDDAFLLPPPLPLPLKLKLGLVRAAAVELGVR